MSGLESEWLVFQGRVEYRVESRKVDRLEGEMTTFTFQTMSLQ